MIAVPTGNKENSTEQADALRSRNEGRLHVTPERFGNIGVDHSHLRNY